VISDTYQADTERAIGAMVTMPELPKAPEAKTSVWSAPFRALPAIASEMGAAVGEVLKGYGEVSGSLGDSGGGMFSLQDDREKQEAEAARRRIQERGPQGRNQVSDALRDVAESYRPDPLTASTAENLVFGLTKTLGKAVGYTALAGPFGAGAFGIDEGLTATDELQRKGVDDVTAQKVGGLTGAAGAASVLLPVVGPTVGKTVALAVAGRAVRPARPGRPGCGHAHASRVRRRAHPRPHQVGEGAAGGRRRGDDAQPDIAAGHARRLAGSGAAARAAHA
jgi:hypothetical protein